MLTTKPHIPRVAIVLLCYNNKNLVTEYLPIIKRTIPQGDDYKIVVVNNAGTDGTDTWVSENHPDVDVIQIAVNKGFTNGYVESLPQVKAKNYVLISADVEPAENWLLPALELLESHDSIAAVQPKVMSWDKRNTFEYAGGAGGYIDFLGYPFCRGRLVDSVEVDKGQFDDVRPIFWASGCCLFIKADLWEKAGGFDNDFFAHMEEIDLCWRLRQMGYEIMYQPKSKVYHMGGSVIKYGSPAKTYQNFRNNAVLLMKNLPVSTLIWLIPIRVFLDWAAMLNMFKNGDFKIGWAVVRAQWSLFTRFRFWWKKRKHVNSLRTTSPTQFGVMPKSLVWAFFVKGKRTYSELNWNQRALCMTPKIDHIQITVKDLSKAEPFYDVLMSFLGFDLCKKSKGKVEDHEFEVIEYFHNNLIIGINSPRSQFANQDVHRRKPGSLHHLAFHASNEKEVDDAFLHLKSKGVNIVNPPQFYPQHGAHYYALFIKDPDGIKFEIVFEKR